MGFRKPLCLLSTYTFPNPMKCSNTHFSATPQCQHSATSTRPSPDRRRRQHRHYATISHDARSPADDYLQWPHPKNPSVPPTPYEIFNQRRGEPYSKHRFYQLVKLYHPDRNQYLDDAQDTSQPANCSRAVALERYRLVIAANSILSDPVKRQVYDRHGWGWSSAHGSDPSQSASHDFKYTTYHRWRTDGTSAYQWPPGQDPMYNATWEDWERWYEAQSPRGRTSSSGAWIPSFFSPGNRQHNTVYASNYRFFSIVFLLAALGGIGQATRFNGISKTRMERDQIVNEETSRLLMKARQDALDISEGGESKEKRIRRFLSQKEVHDDAEFDARMLRAGDDGMCASGAIKDKDEPKFWQKPPER